MQNNAERAFMTDSKVQNSVFIIDGSSFLYRAYYSIRPLHAPDGKPVQAVYGFCRMIKKILDSYDPHFMVLVWDSKGKTARHDLYPEYKSTRQAVPNDLIAQKELIQRFADIISIPQLQMPGIEADDLMFSLAKELEHEQIDSILVTSDKDLRQALSERIEVLDPFKDEFITRQSLEQKIEFPISKLPFYYALLGDSSDNIPGVKGVGPKNAKELVQQFESLEDLYTNIDKVRSDRIRELCLTSRDNAFLSLELFLLRYHELHMSKASCMINPDTWKQAYPFFTELNFKSLLKNINQQPTEKKPTISEVGNYQFITITQEEELRELCNQIKQAKKCAIDTETTGLTALAGVMVGISVCVEEGKAYYIPFGHKTSETQLSRTLVFGLLKAVFEDTAIAKYLHHAKFDMLMLASEGIELKNVVFDTMIAANLVVEDGQRIGLKYLSSLYLQEPMMSFSDVVTGKDCKDFSYVPLPLATQYAAADAHQTLQLQRVFEKELEKKQLTQVFHDIEMPLMQVLFEMEREGIQLDTSILKTMSVAIDKELSSLHQQIIDLIGPTESCINLNSPKQLEELLFVKLQLPVVKKTAQKTGYSTDQDVLRVLATIHPVPGLIMRYRELFKLKSTYVDALQEYAYPETGKIHTTFSQTGVSTGRLSSSGPNLQNIPVDKYHIRSAFKAPEGHLFLSADYSQIELRVLAYLSQDSTLLEAFAQNKDIHALTAAGLFGVPLDQVTHEQRQLGKRINFSILYGLTPHGLSKDLGITHALARNYIDTFMKQYQGVAAWMEKVIEETKSQGYVTTHWGRRRYLPGIYERNKSLYELAKRVAINTKAQGTAAEIMKLGMIKLATILKQEKWQAKIVLQIHDELLLHVPVAEALKIEKKVLEVLQTIVSWNVPLLATTRIGANWQEVTK